MKRIFKTVSRLLLCGMVVFSLSACHKNNDPKPDEGDKDKTEEVVTPTDPETPENPDTPETPETPDNPQEPENPETPQEPETPEEPNTPEEPQEPESPQVPEGMVDLGLSVYWATSNIGASSPEQHGDYYAWGETSTKSAYRDGNCATYNKSLEELKSSGIVDANGNLTADYDVAQKLDKGRMPTLTEIRELTEKCTWTWTTQNDVNGYEVTGPNGNSIFLPAEGYRSFSSSSDVGSRGYYWSSTALNERDCAYDLYFNSSSSNWNGNYRRYYGCSVRPVSNK